MESETQAVYVLVRIELPAEMDEFEVDEVVSDTDYSFDHPAIEDTEISGLSMNYPLGF